MYKKNRFNKSHHYEIAAYHHRWPHLQSTPCDTCSRTSPWCWYSWSQRDSCAFLYHIHRHLQIVQSYHICNYTHTCIHTTTSKFSYHHILVTISTSSSCAREFVCERVTKQLHIHIKEIRYMRTYIFHTNLSNHLVILALTTRRHESMCHNKCELLRWTLSYNQHFKSRLETLFSLTCAGNAISRISQHALAVEGPICIETIGVCVAVV